jgi:hypothetical protein
MGLGVQYAVHNNDVRTVLRGLMTRVFTFARPDGTRGPPVLPNNPLARVTIPLIEEVKQFAKFIGAVAPLNLVDIPGAYRGRKRKNYERAVESLITTPVCQRDARLKTFVKTEKLNTSAKPDPDPRVIQPYDIRLLAMRMRWTRPLEHATYRAIDKLYGGATVMKGLNAKQRGAAICAAWRKYKDPHGFGLDCSRFDGHCLPPLLTIVSWLYLHVYGRNSPIAELEDWTMNSKGMARCQDGFVRYQVDGRVVSGSDKTGFGNIVMMMAMIGKVLRDNGLIGRISPIDDGDDAFMIGERADIEHLHAVMTQAFAEFGHELKCEPIVNVIEEIEFCQSHPVWDGGKYVMVRDPRVAIDKDLVCVRPVRNVNEYNFYRGSISECGIRLAGNMPVWGQFYAALGRNLPPKWWANRKNKPYEAPITGMTFLSKGMDAFLREPNEATRLSFSRAFSIPVHIQREMESMYRSQNICYTQPGIVRKFNSLRNWCH